MRTRRGKGRHSGKTAALRGTERHPKPGATPDSECGSSARPDSGHVRRASRPVRGAGVLHWKDCGRHPKPGVRTRGAAGRGAAVERIRGGHRREHSPPGRPGVGRPSGKHRSARDARCATTKRSKPGVRTRGAPVPGSAGWAAGHGSFPPPPCSFPPDAPPFSEEKAGVVFRRFGGLPAPVLRRRSPRFRRSTQKGEGCPSPLDSHAQSRRKKRPPLAPKNPA